MTDVRALPVIQTIPSSDRAFREHVLQLVRRPDIANPTDLETRLRKVFPRVLVRRRELSGESPSWYVYRDGGWTPSGDSLWWEAPNLPSVTVTTDGWIVQANPAARSLLGIDDRETDQRHYSDFVAPGTLEDAQALLGIVSEGHELTATVLLRPTAGEVIACELHTARRGSELTGVLRLAEDIKVHDQSVPRPVEIVTHPAADAGFNGYAELLLARMSEPTVDGLALRLRRLYPHARVEATGDRWVVFRDATGVDGPADGWWLDRDLPTVRYDAQALILEANRAARKLLGSPLTGHYWQEFVTPGGTARVAEFLPIIKAAGVVISRFRMPAADGTLVEFDSFTEAEDETFTTVMRPRDR